MRQRPRTALVVLSAPLAAGLLFAGCGKPKPAGPPPAPPEVGVVTIQPQRVAVTTGSKQLLRTAPTPYRGDKGDVPNYLH